MKYAKMPEEPEQPQPSPPVAQPTTEETVHQETSEESTSESNDSETERADKLSQLQQQVQTTNKVDKNQIFCSNVIKACEFVFHFCLSVCVFCYYLMKRIINV